MRIPISGFFRALLSGTLLMRLRERFGFDPADVSRYIREGAQN
jgi:hypothetical protein